VVTIRVFGQIVLNRCKTATYADFRSVCAGLNRAKRLVMSTSGAQQKKLHIQCLFIGSRMTLAA